jgi:multidrug efflux pump
MRMAVLIVFGLIVAAAFVLFSVLPRELAPNEDRGVFLVQVRAPEGSSFKYTYDQMLKVEKVLMRFVHRGVVKRILVRAPAGWGASGSYNTGMAFVVLEDWSKRKESGEQVVNEIRRALAPIPSVKAAAFMPQALGGGGGGRPVQFVLQGPTYQDLAAWSKTIMADAKKSGLLLNVDSDYEENTPELRVALDRDRAASIGVSVQEVGNTLQTLLGGKRISEFPFRGEERDVIAQAAGVDRATVQDLSDYYVRSNKGELVPLANVVHWTRDGTAQRLNRYNRMRAVTISAELAPGVSLGKALNFLVTSVKRDLPPSAQYDFAGQSADFQESQSSFLGTFALALLVVFLVLAAQFESFRHPFIVMLTVPLAITGALFGLLMTNGTLNIYSEVGIIILIGIAAKNGILLVEFANQQRDAGLSIREAIIEAARTRFRPILMTAISTAMGAVPLAFAAGPGSAARQTIGIVVFSGVIFATALTLIVIPVVYDLLARGTRSPKTIANELSELEARHTHGSAISPAE